MTGKKRKGCEEKERKKKKIDEKENLRERHKDDFLSKGREIKEQKEKNER